MNLQKSSTTHEDTYIKADRQTQTQTQTHTHTHSHTHTLVHITSRYRQIQVTLAGRPVTGTDSKKKLNKGL